MCGDPLINKNTPPKRLWVSRGGLAIGVADDLGRQAPALISRYLTFPLARIVNSLDE